MKTRKTTDAVEILHDLFVRGKPSAESILKKERERLRVAIDLHESREPQRAKPRQQPPK